MGDRRRCDPVEAIKQTTVGACGIATQSWRGLVPVHAAAEFPRMEMSSPAGRTVVGGHHSVALAVARPGGALR